MTETRDQRRAAAEFYYKPSGITGRVQDWIDILDNEGDVDADVRDLATLLAQREAAAVERERERCAAYCDARAVQERCDALRASDALAGEHGLGAYDQGRVDALHDAAIGIGSRPAPGEGE